MAEVNEKIPFPEFEEIDEDAFEVLLDIDLDQLTVLFYGPERRYSVRPRNPVLSVLEDAKSGDVVGIAFDRFAKQVLIEHPQMILMAMAATVLAGDEIFEPGQWREATRPKFYIDRLRSSTSASIKAFREYEDTSPKALYSQIVQFA